MVCMISNSNICQSPLHVHLLQDLASVHFLSLSLTFPFINLPLTLFIALQLPLPVFAHVCESWQVEGRHLNLASVDNMRFQILSRTNSKS